MGILDKVFGRKKGPENVYQDMRTLWLQGELPSLEPAGVQAVMMEMGVATTRVCVLAAPDGSASMYLESGGGMIGGHGAPAVAEAAKELVRQAGLDVARLAPSKAIPTADLQGVAFAVRTPQGLRVASASRSDVDAGSHPLRALFERAQDVITQFRRRDMAMTPFQVYLHGDGGIEVSNASHRERVWCTLEQLREAVGEARDVGARLVLHAPASGDRAFTAALQILGAVEGWERLAPPEDWPDGASSLEMVVAAKRLDLTTDLLARGADLSAVDANGYDVLMVACNLGNAAVVQAVLGAGADPNRRDPEGNTALMFAAQRQDSESVTLLLRAGADAGARGDHGLTALGIAKQYPDNPAARTLLESGAPE